ncbi:MAG: virulence factor [Acidimicrobiia bacterium]
MTVIYWRDIPAQVLYGHGHHAIRAEMPKRFQQAIDRAATRAGLVGSDEYMEQWRKAKLSGESDPVVVARRLEIELGEEALEELVHNQGHKVTTTS